MKLSKILKKASHWKANLLLDEADIFVEQRAHSDINRNALVCVLLRKLEYYHRILFLTTNRVKAIDEAIARRIHLALRYKMLDQNARIAVWKIFLERASRKEVGAKCSSEEFAILARIDLNGREVRFIVCQ